MPIESTLTLRQGRQTQARTAGYTLVELIAVLIILGVLSAIAAPRFFSASSFRDRGFYDEVRSAVRYAHKLAIASGCDVEVVLNAASDSYSLRYRSVAGTPCPTGSFGVFVARPDGGGVFQPTSEPGVDVGSSLAVYFDAAGVPHTSATGNPLAATASVAIGSETLNIEHVTGLVYP